MDTETRIETYIPDGYTVAFRIKKKEEIIGTVLVAIYEKYVEVLHILVEKKYRNKGYAQKLVQYLMDNYEYIIIIRSCDMRRKIGIILALFFILCGVCGADENDKLPQVMRVKVDNLTVLDSQSRLKVLLAVSTHLGKEIIIKPKIIIFNFILTNFYHP